MRVIAITMFVLILVTGLVDCSRHSSSEGSLIGNYELQGHEYSGQLIFTGAILITSLENSELKGMCKVVKVNEAFEGAVSKDGPCEAKVSGDKITLDLAPSLSDGGLVFEGHWSEGRISGTWRIESVAGGKTFGTFDAVKH